ncbi:hypothetical protein vBRpoPV17_21 [Ruegeria phage vB_RpoP-V17]|uniref:Uncharacterized protein n=3 Tax=Aorunvirus V12 TaxID=2846074 RepID=A0A2Z4QFZ8_9CAUD|nr:hypothetical protein HYP62_gp21 [Ruegeria phage vB_RpoP-V12]AWY08808.1 hypothetical protein vBRpoPV12_21 [Ruegeria phage vB_RpoP-V12]AWY08979.1 hypothetical protein vBRpoPV21_21 [Ruegeria phage vB_RpoP-V21]AWY09540.1 hypothetical protein vBRpoPV17_21 [Ruegeria phage vB_RpoP-V17]
MCIHTGSRFLRFTVDQTKVDIILVRQDKDISEDHPFPRKEDDHDGQKKVDHMVYSFC